VYSLAFVLAASAGFALLSPEPASSRGIESSPVKRARGGETLWVDGNLNGYGVSFPHEEMQKRLGGKDSCVKCHHMNLPRDRNSGCYECHSNMYLATNASRHDWHASTTGGRLACWQCHAKGSPRSAATAKPCASCHKDLVPAGAAIQVKQYRAVGYLQAMHELCIGCHVRLAKQNDKPDLARCTNCHKKLRNLIDATDLTWPRQEVIGRGMLLPPVSKR
jgi:hypothetical protein